MLFLAASQWWSSVGVRLRHQRVLSLGASWSTIVLFSSAGPVWQRWQS
jgi:hypothetical protein